MKVQQAHRDEAVAGIQNKKTTLEIKQGLMAQGLTKTQANCCVRNQRKRLKPVKENQNAAK